MIDNTKNTQISVFDIKIKRIFVANNVLLNNTIMKKLLLLAFVLCSSLLCRAQEERVILGDEQTSEYFPILKDKRIAIFSNHTGMIGDKHLLDILLENKFNVVAIFSPEHGFRGDADAGEHVSSSVDKKTGVPILSLYDGKSGKPSETSMRKFDILVVDIQDVGLRFYTYYASMYLSSFTERIVDGKTDSQLFAMLTQQFHFFIGIGRKLIESYDNRLTE